MNKLTSVTIVKELGMSKIRLLDRRSGLQMDFNGSHAASVERLVDDGKWTYKKIFWPTELVLDGHRVYEFKSSKRYKRSYGWHGPKS